MCVKHGMMHDGNSDVCRFGKKKDEKNKSTDSKVDSKTGLWRQTSDVLSEDELDRMKEERER